MAKRKEIPRPIKPAKKGVPDRIRVPEKSETLSINFSKFKFKPICLKGKFNNHFKDDQQYTSIMTSLFSVILPKITSHSYRELNASSSESRQLHFHTIDDKHCVIVKEILKEYNFSDIMINQMFEGNNIYEFVASLGHTYPARIVCHKVGNVLYFLFIDTNHHIYINEKYVGESMFYEDCPKYLEKECPYMPRDCFAVSYLDEKKILESYDYEIEPLG